MLCYLVARPSIYAYVFSVCMRINIVADCQRPVQTAGIQPTVLMPAALMSAL